MPVTTGPPSHPMTPSAASMTAAAPRAYALADRFWRLGTPVVLGGMHPTFMPDEALRHADAVCVGEAEPAE